MFKQSVIAITSMLVLAGSSKAWIEGTQPVATRPLTPPIATAEISDDAVTTDKISPAGGAVGQVLTVTAGPDVEWGAAGSDGDWTISGNNQYSAVSGNVGIGTTTPETKLAVVGDGSSWAKGFLSLKNQNADAGIRIFDDISTGVKHHIYNNNGDADKLRICPAGDYTAGGITIAQSGNVCIGTTTTSNPKLYVLNTGSSGSAGYFSLDNAANAHPAITAITEGTNYAGWFSNGNNGKGVLVYNILHIVPRSSAPASPTEGDIYVNLPTHHIYCYLGGVWKQLD